MDNRNRWRTVGVAVQGASHIKSDLPCQDAVEWKISGEWLIAAVADGAGSAKESQRGAHLACAAAVQFLEGEAGPEASHPERAESLLKKALGEARRTILQEAATSGIAAREMATTLLLVMARADFMAAAQVGDGAVVLRNDKQELIALTKPPSAEYLNETTFITTEEGLESAQVVSRAGELSGLVIFTDGLQMLALKMPDAVPHTPFFTPLFNYLDAESDMERGKEKIRAWLTSPKITQRADDDLTLFLAVVESKT